MFKVSSLPMKARGWFHKESVFWPAATTAAIDDGFTNLEDLTDMVFFMHHRDRISRGIGRALDPKEPNFKKLAAEWKGFRSMIIPVLKKAGTSPKKPFFKSGPVEVELPNWMSSEAKRWARKPAKSVRVKRFEGERRFWGDAVIWKNSGKVDAYLERPTDLDFIRDQLPKTKKDLAGKVQDVNQQYNQDMSFYVETKKLSPTAAEARLRKEWGETLYGMVSGLTTF